MALVTQQQLEDASRDADDLGLVINGAADLNTTGTVPTRTGGDRKTIAKLEAEYQAIIDDQTIQEQLAEDWAEGTLPGGPGTKSSKEWATEAGVSAGDAADSAADALVTLGDVNTAGTTQVAAVNTAGSTQVAAVTAEGTAQVGNVALAGSSASAVAASYFNGLSTGEYDVLSETAGPSLVATLASNIGVIQRGFINGSDIATGDVITAIRTLWAAGATTATTEIKVWKRNVAGATGAGTLNNAAPIATHDTLVATFSTTPAVLGITPGTSNPTQTADYPLPSPITVEGGYDYIVQMRNLDGSAVVVNLGATYVTVSSAVAQRRAGFYANTATPTTFINETTTRPISFTLLKNKQKTQLPATDTTLRTLIDNVSLQTLAEMNARNAANLHVNAVLFPVAFSNPVNLWGDSLINDDTGGGSAPVSGSRVFQVVDLAVPGDITATVTNTNGTPTLTVTAGTVPSVGMSIVGTGVPAGAYVQSVAGSVVTMSANSTAPVTAITSSYVNNFGINGQTSTQITTRATAAPAALLAGYNRVQQGTNDLGAGSPATVIANYASAAAAFTNANYLMASPWLTGATTANINGRFIGDVRADLRTAYGAKFLDSQAMWARYGADASDQLVARRGGVPTDLTVDGLHKNSGGGLVHGQTHALAALAQAGGAPFVHDEMFGFKAGDASGAAIGTPRVLGTGYNFRVLAGNEDGAVQVNRATGAITRTANTILQPYRELFIEAENTKGHGRNGRNILVQQMDGTLPNKAVRVRGNGASVLMSRYDSAPAAGPEMTVVAVLRHTQFRASGGGGANIITAANNSSIMGQSNWQTNFNFRDSAGAILGSRMIDPESPSKFNFYAFAIKTDTGLMKARCNLETPTSAAPSAGNVDPSKFAYFFSNGGDTLPWIGDIMMLIIYPAYYDITNDAVIANWWDNTTRMPKDTGASGTAGGTFTTPLWYLRGMAGDYLLGKNYGSLGNLHVQVPISARDVGFLDVSLT